MSMPGFSAELTLQHRPGRNRGMPAREPLERGNAVHPLLRPVSSGWICDFIWDCCEGGSFACCWYWIFNCTGEGTVAVTTGTIG